MKLAFRSKKRYFKKNQRAFTLIEVLVVVSIISFLSTLMLISFSKARIKARDAKRKVTLNQLQKVVELYKDANAGAYPGSINTTYFTSDPVFCNTIAPYVVNPCHGFKDPQTGSYVYMRPAAGGYILGARFEESENQSQALMGWAGGYGEPAGMFYLYWQGE